MRIDKWYRLRVLQIEIPGIQPASLVERIAHVDLDSYTSQPALLGHIQNMQAEVQLTAAIQHLGRTALPQTEAGYLRQPAQMPYGTHPLLIEVQSKWSRCAIPRTRTVTAGEPSLTMWHQTVTHHLRATACDPQLFAIHLGPA